MSQETIENLFNTIIVSNSKYHKLSTDTLFNEIKNYTKLDINEPLEDPNSLEINSIKQGEDKELYIVRPLHNEHIWILVPRK